MTHFVDEHKLDQIEQAGIAAIEIDLSMLRDATFGALEVALFDNPTGTRWLYQPEMAKTKLRLRDSIQWLLDAATESAAARARMRTELDEADRVEREALQAEQETRRKAEAEMQAARKYVVDEALRRHAP